jgi:hypothetical protein
MHQPQRTIVVFRLGSALFCDINGQRVQVSSDWVESQTAPVRYVFAPAFEERDQCPRG